MGEDTTSGRQPNRKLRRQRELCGWSQADVEKELGDLAARNGEMGPDRNSFGRWERGVHRPQPRNIRLLCQLFELPAEELGLIPETEPAPSPPEGLPRVFAEPPADDTPTVWTVLPTHHADSELFVVQQRLSAAERVAPGQALGQNIETAWKQAWSPM
jgi:transcriptional regulator with XRE-family HTH domain